MTSILAVANAARDAKVKSFVDDINHKTPKVSELIKMQPHGITDLVEKSLENP
ncbi:hypothetical protein [Candidatus Odyssella acanthamoebae]|uniref:hypothetical protein n=1 Tax=Candidatus Odyssella acanthamoebae TaxID=91604 RepID=UPI0012EC864A|nr:hypothetical protein [Candidatus Paracaedibacter acanthamoebae]